ncbi:TonB-dependent siderophore receptor [Alcanivorax sediminis]|uniref:TonB-dependent siderophore receptor n=1 Tax=Alcanivorax sediminis TaxID=2663008 RepID=A0A6N7LUV2_9GAMM|nr:TonB-dependent siderophore receptor [Alcanivorax sediminis]MQX52121.1 TonB-dependent siderophore receptor [Alcanivorax sediminis]
MKFRLFAGAVSASLLLQPHLALAEEPDANNDSIVLETVEVGGKTQGRLADNSESYTPKTSVSAPTGLSLSRRETPQSVSVITETQMDDFQMNGVSDVLASTPGVAVDRVETDRIYYNARGFEITNFQFDGLGQPLPYETVSGDMDTAQFERVEVIRGSNGLMTGLGNPSATVNYVRKRPTADTSGSLALTYGSWNAARVEGDLSGAINKSGSVRGRVVAAYDDKESYLDRYEKESGLFYGVVEADITENTLLTIGYSQQNENADSPLWGSLPLFYKDGAPTDYDVETSTSADWSYWDNDTTMAFAELQQRFENGWEAKGVFTYRKLKGDSELLYVFGAPDRNDAGLFAYPSLYDNETTERVYDLYARGPFEVGGRVHEMIVGVNYAKGRNVENSQYIAGNFVQFAPDQSPFDGSFPRPTAYEGTPRGSKWDDRYRSGYLATRLSLADPLTVIAGGRYVDVLSKGEGYGSSKDASASELVPYAGIVFDLNEVHSVYASYTEIFNPQTEENSEGQRVDPVTGETYEAGLKSEWQEGRVYTQLTAFWTDQKDLAEAVNASPDTFFNGQDYESSGYEAEISGELLPGWQLSGGYTFLDIEKNDEGIEQRTYTPREIIRLTTSYRPSGLEKLKVGARVSWQDSIYRGTAPAKRTQEAYTLVDLMAGYDWTRQFSTTLNVNNVSDEKYLNSLYVGQAFYGAPRNASIRFDYKF